MLASLLGCAPNEQPLPPVVWEGDTVRVHMDDPASPVCGGSFEALDLHARLVRQAMMLGGANETIEYSIGDQQFVDTACSRSPQACTDITNGNVFTADAFCQHEIVHSVRILDPSVRLLSPAIEEGLATLFGSDVLDNGTIDLDALGILNEPWVSGSAEYYRAGQTIALLLDRHGMEKFRHFDLLAHMIGEDDAFEAAFGETKEDFAAAADASAHCERSQWWLPLIECSGTPQRADPETDILTLSGKIRCGESDVIGPIAGYMWTSRHFRLEGRTTNISYDFNFPEDATLEIVACDIGCPERFAYSGGLWDVGSVRGGVPGLEPGDYFLRMSRPVTDEDGQFEVIIHQLNQ